VPRGEDGGWRIEDGAGINHERHERHERRAANAEHAKACTPNIEHRTPTTNPLPHGRSPGNRPRPRNRRDGGFPVYTPILSIFPMKTHNLTRFPASFTRLLTYTQKMCTRPSSFRTGCVWTVYQTLRVWLLSGCAAGTRLIPESAICNPVHLVHPVKKSFAAFMSCRAKALASLFAFFEAFARKIGAFRLLRPCCRFVAV
jgi:hypothetical protein